MFRHLKKYPFTIAWTAILFYLSLSPKIEIPQTDLLQVDKVLHFGFYLVYTLILVFESQRQYLKISKRLMFIYAIVFCSFVGFIIELLQGYCIPGRVYDGFDILANLIGACSAFIIFPFIKSN